MLTELLPEHSNAVTFDQDDEWLVKELGLQQPFPEDILVLKNPQLLAVQFGKQHPRFILSFDKGMGKTLTYLLIYQASGVDKLLILCTKGAMLRQLEEVENYFPEWLPDMVFVKGQNAAQRRKYWEQDAKIYVCSYITFLADMGRRKTSAGLSERIAPAWCNNVPFAICDEYHRVMRNRSKSTKKNAILELVKDTCPNSLVLSSGSAANKGPQSMWAALNLIDRKTFSTYWGYVGQFCVVEDTHFGKQIVGVKNIGRWRNLIAPYVFHRKKDLKDYPPKTRKTLPVEMEAWEQRIHDELKENLITILPNDALLAAPNTLAATHKIRQLLICPKFLDDSLGYGAGLEGILEDVQDSELSHWVISTPYTGPMPLIGQFFREHGWRPEFLRGGMDMDDMRAAIRRWTENGGPIIQSIEFAESYELPAARDMYMLGYMHDPERNMQAEDRIHRDIRVTPHHVNIWYIKHRGAYDQNILDALTLHADNVHFLMNTPASELFTHD